MVAIKLHHDFPHSQLEVWKEISNLGGQGRWMGDVATIVFLTDQTAGTGTQVQVKTKVGPFRTDDFIDVVDWVEGRKITIRHRGLFTGIGSFRLDSLAGRTRMTWNEEIRFPWRWGGWVAALVARPLLAAIWRKNLLRLERLLSKDL